MIYEKRLTLPANTAQASALETDVEIHPGTVTLVEILFPAGCAGLAHVQILHWERVLWPSNPDGDFSGNGDPITFAEDYAITDPPFLLTLRGWNDDELYPHTPIVRFQITPFSGGLLGQLGALITGPRRSVGGE